MLHLFIRYNLKQKYVGVFTFCFLRVLLILPSILDILWHTCNHYIVLNQNKLLYMTRKKNGRKNKKYIKIKGEQIIITYSIHKNALINWFSTHITSK